MLSKIATAFGWIVALALAVLLAIAVDILTDPNARQKWVQRRVRWARGRKVRSLLWRRIWLTLCVVAALPIGGGGVYAAVQWEAAMHSIDAAQLVLTAIGEPRRSFVLQTGEVVEVSDWSLEHWAEGMRQSRLDFRAAPGATTSTCYDQWKLDAPSSLTVSDCWRFAQYKQMEARYDRFTYAAGVIASLFGLALVYICHRWGHWIAAEHVLQRLWLTMCMSLIVPATLTAIGALGAGATNTCSAGTDLSMSLLVYKIKQLAKPPSAIDSSLVNPTRPFLLRLGETKQLMEKNGLEQLNASREPYELKTYCGLGRWDVALTDCARSLTWDFDRAEQSAEQTGYMFLGAVAAALLAVGLYRWGIWIATAHMRRRARWLHQSKGPSVGDV